jgi:hypothetical protein
MNELASSYLEFGSLDFGTDFIAEAGPLAEKELDNALFSTDTGTQYALEKLRMEGEDGKLITV